MGKLTEALERFGRDYVYPPMMTTLEKHDTSWIYKQLTDVGFLTSGMKRLHLDSKYWACSKKEFQDWITWDWTNKKKYISEQYDCDNFAFNFKARVARKFGVNSVGLVIDYSGGHAYNLIVFSDGTWKIFEPQNDRWPTIRTGQYKFEDGFILI